MNRRSVTEVLDLTEEVTELAAEYIRECADRNVSSFIMGTALTGKLRRRSMDLTRALAKMRSSR